MNSSLFRTKIIIILCVLLFSARFGLGQMYTSASGITVDSVLRAVNNERSTRNISTLRTDSRLSAAANYKSGDMIARSYFAHVDPDGHYIWDKIVASGYTPYTILGENLAVDFSDTEGLMSAWIDSPTHRANILNASFKDQGAGVALGSGSSSYSIAITNTFGAQPVAKTTTPPATTTPPVTAAPKTTTTPKKVTTTPKKVVTTPKVAQKKGISISINNTEPVIYHNNVTIVGTIDSSLPVTLHEKDGKLPDATVTPDASGNFIYSFKDLTSGEYGISAKVQVDTETVETPPYALEVQYNPPTLDPEKIVITPELTNEGLKLHVLGETTTDTTSVTATILSTTSQLPVADGKFEGDVLLTDKYLDFDSNQMVLSAEDKYGNKTENNIPLKGIKIPSEEDPNTFHNASQAPDLYNVFKYIVMFFGALFAFFLLTDSIILNRKKITSLDQIGGSSNFMILFLLLSSLALITWWH